MSITTEQIIKKLEEPKVEISIKNSDTIAEVIFLDGKYLINVNNNLEDQLIMYFIFHEVSHILNKDLSNSTAANFFMEFEEVDIYALTAYLDHNFDRELIRNSQLFEEKIKNEQFLNILNKYGVNT